MWVRDLDGMKFKSEDEAFSNAHTTMLTSAITGDYLKPWVSYDELLNWAMKQDGFFDYFEDEFYRAQQNYFNDFYFEIEDNENEER